MTDVVIAGASGFIGSHLSAAFRQEGRSVRTIGRGRAADAVWGDADGLTRVLDGAALLINLAGKPVHARYDDASRNEILRSRVETTRELGEAVARSAAPPALWLNQSTATAYSHSTTHAHTEDDPTGQQGFSEDVARAWEREFELADAPATRRAAMRTTIALGHDSEATRLLFRLARLGLGGPQIDGWWFAHDRYRSLAADRGSEEARAPSRGRGTRGRQRFSWIHIDDVVGAVRHIEATPSITGPVNFAAPEASTNAELMRLLRQTVGMPIGIPAPRFVLEPATWLLRTESELLLKSRWVSPGKLLASGYVFQQPRLDWSLRDIWARMRAGA
ncbi:hypothetical protein SAMN04487783_0934 [Agrococcus baldri]|uniref:NAD-dependent epimerase n=1 Tax=Agrococcus baldri TaxID=153730 RepID=A0AA94HLH7_9MICO|nr:DUF1731 domain-containing protein [Agrococcus baldri]SFS07255.1 hypothetical protein SAMN04487783_0934 [Agrococcus baldri]